MKLKIYGYENTEECRLLEMSEVTFCTTPDVLRKIADFIHFAADELEAHAADFDHTHLGDKWEEFGSSKPDVIVAQPEI